MWPPSVQDYLQEALHGNDVDLASYLSMANLDLLESELGLADLMNIENFLVAVARVCSAPLTSIFH